MHNGAMRSFDAAEQRRLAEADQGRAPWRAWGPYLSERAWGTVREDYSAHGDSWSYFPHEHARSRAYRWNEDGLGGICDDQQRFCFGFAFWNGVDPILKERIFGLTGPEGNHGEDAKEYWWYLDSTPTHSYMRWRYHYPQAEFPYTGIREANLAAGRDAPEIELLDTGVFADDRYWTITVDYAKADVHDMAVRVTVANRGPVEATLDVLPTLWFRNTWAWDADCADPPVIEAREGRLVATHPELGTLVLDGDGISAPLACDNETNTWRLWHLPGRTPYPKDGINDHVVNGAPTVNPDRTGTKAALHYRLTVAPGQSAEIRLRLTAADPTAPRADLGTGFREVLAARAAEADEFFADLTPPHAGADEARVLRQAVAGLLWSKQFYHYDVQRWLDGDPTAAPPPPGRMRNARWTHLRCHDVIMMPDPWEYPWFAAWDLAFHCVALAHVDPGFAKRQLLLLLGDRYQHEDGSLPAYEWAFDDANPPVHAWAALQVFHRDGGWDRDFLCRALPGLERNFDWWMRNKSVCDMRVFGGGFLGLDNVGPFDRTWPPPDAGNLVQSDGTAWMAMFALHLAEIATIVAERVPDAEVMGEKAHHYVEQFTGIVADAYEHGLWDDESGFFYDVLCRPDGTVRVPARSVVGLLPLCVSAPPIPTQRSGPPAMVDSERLRRALQKMLDEAEFLSPHGIRSLSSAHRDAPVTVILGDRTYDVAYEPAESRTSTFGGNSNWRGPIWFPVNVLMVNALRDHHRHLGDEFRVQFPTGSGEPRSLGEIADALARRLLALFLPDDTGRRPVFGDSPVFQSDPEWRDGVLFYEYFHGDTGAGLGAAHQTGWTALVIELIRGAERSVVR